ncbi:MAG TPA: hypothetical protein VMX97_10830 [Hyphomicrobiaceae bacterium]|nr:hypothetical protein [Hyphomicrobiaceae bacterium]
MTPFHPPLLRNLALALPVTLALGAVAVVTSISPDALIRASLPASTPVAMDDPMMVAAQSGNLGTHVRMMGRALEQTPIAVPAVAGPPGPVPNPASRQGFRLGDQLTISGSDGRNRIFAVSSIREVPQPVVQAVGSAATPRLLIVTCVNISDRTSMPLRFIVEADRAAPQTVTSHAQQDL